MQSNNGDALFFKNNHDVKRVANPHPRSSSSSLARIALFASIMLVATLFAPQAADASIVTVTGTGTVASGTDTTGVFVAKGASLAGLAFTVTATYNDTEGTQSVGYCSGVPCTSQIVTSSYGSPGTAVLQIGGGSWTFGGLPGFTPSTSAFRTIETPGDYASFTLQDLNSGGSAVDTLDLDIYPPSGAPLTNYSWEAALSLSSLGTGTNHSLFSIPELELGGVEYTASGTLTLTSVTISGPQPTGPPSPVKALGAPCNTPGSCQRGDPVNVTTGNLSEKVMDYTTAGQNPLAFTRYYNSMGNASNVTTFAATLGTNWRSNYDRYLDIGSTTVIAERPDGQQLTFNLVGGVWTTDSDVDVTLTNLGTSWTLTDHNDTVENYTSSGIEGVLNTITARNGYQQTLSYSGGLLQSVTDSYSRSLHFTYSGGLLQTVTTPDTLVLTYVVTPVTGGNQLTSVSYNTSPATSQTYKYEDSSYPFALTGIVDENSNRFATWAYDTSGRVTSSQHGTGTSIDDLTTFAYNAPTQTTVTNAFGVADTYMFGPLLNGLKISRILRAATSTTAAASWILKYDSNGYVNSVTDWNGNVTTYVNNSHGEPTTINEAVGSTVARTTTISYDPTWVRLPHQIVTTGLTSTFVYDGSGDPLTRTDLDTTTNTVPYSTNGQSRVTTWTWSSTGQEKSIQLPRTDVTAKTSFGYTGGTLTSITDALSHVTNITSYTGGGLPLTIVDPNSVTTTLTYDARLNLHTSTLATTAGNLVTTWTHDPANQLTALQLPDNSKLAYGYDTAHRLTTITDLFSNTINYTLDALGDKTLTQIENPSATVTKQHSATFDALGRVLHDIGGVSQTTVYTYDKNGNALTVTPPSPSGVITYTYDALNRLLTSKDPSPGGTTTLTHDTHDRVLTAKDANSHTTTYTYNGFGDRTQAVSPDSGTTVMHYDPDRNMTQIVKAGSLTANMTYDADDRKLTATYPSQTSLNVSRTYDQTGSYGFGVGRLTSWTDATGSGGRVYDERGNVTGESRIVSGIGTLNTATAYDAASRIAGITYPSGTVVLYTRDSMGRVTGLTAEPPGGTAPTDIATSITYEPFGPVTGLTYGNGMTGTYGFDLDYRPTTRVDTGTAAVQNLTYAYYANNSVETITDAVNAANSQSLNYDALDRLTSATSGTGGYGTYGWTWDEVRNVETQVINGTTTSYSLNTGTNQLKQWVTGSTTEVVASTPAGNVNTLKIGTTTEETLTYNQANQLSSAVTTTTSAAYGYDLFGQRLEKAEYGMNPVAFQYGNHGELLAENDFHSGQVADYIWLNGQPIGEVNPGSTSGIYFMHTDRLGTPQKVTNLAQTVVWNALYTPFGVSSATGTLTTQSLRLPGQYYDPETGMNHNGFRDYSGATTRYVESDPIGLGGGMNTFQYVGGNPYKHADRSGLQYKETFLDPFMDWLEGPGGEMIDSAMIEVENAYAQFGATLATNPYYVAATTDGTAANVAAGLICGALKSVSPGVPVPDFGNPNSSDAWEALMDEVQEISDDLDNSNSAVNGSRPFPTGGMSYPGPQMSFPINPKSN